MSDAEFLAGWMEPDSILLMDSELRWHTRVHVNLGCDYCAHDLDSPVDLDLTRLREIEARLTSEQRANYEESLNRRWLNPARVDWWWFLLHADAPTKISALADALDPERKVRGPKGESDV